ncbi:MAG: GNAT family N-acetyltransferase [Crenarchaeota archaeon]|nr:GNAT family N-acetyltransferase [Thermoproteota archaeon]
MKNLLKMLASEIRKIRKIRAEDLDKISKIVMEVFPEDCNIIIRYIRYIYAFVRDHSYIVEINNELVGFSINSVEYGRGHVMYLAVKSNYRRRGIGKALLCVSLIHFFHQLDLSEVFLEVQTENIPAIKLYESLGFRIVRRIPRYYVDGSDCYVMIIDRGTFDNVCEKICMRLLNNYDLHEVGSLFSKSSRHDYYLSN